MKISYSILTHNETDSLLNLVNFIIDYKDDESGYDDNLPYRNLLKKPYTRMKLPTYRDTRGGNPLSESQAKQQMNVLYEKVIKRFVNRGKDYNVYRSYKYDKMVTTRVLNLNLGKILSPLYINSINIPG